MSKHTQGEWGFRGAEGCIGTEQQLVACVYPMEGENAEELAANMRLIAAAPDLLDALCEMIEGDEEAIMRAEALGIPFPEEMLGAYKKARAAIAKATGDE